MVSITFCRIFSRSTVIFFSFFFFENDCRGLNHLPVEMAISDVKKKRWNSNLNWLRIFRAIKWFVFIVRTRNNGNGNSNSSGNGNDILYVQIINFTCVWTLNGWAGAIQKNYSLGRYFIDSSRSLLLITNEAEIQSAPHSTLNLNKKSINIFTFCSVRIFPI